MTEKDKVIEGYAKEKADKIVEVAIEEVERIFTERNLKPQEHEGLFKDYVREYTRLLSEKYIENLEMTALEQTEKNQKTKEQVQVREFLPKLESFGYSNTKVENHLANPHTKLNAILEMEGENKGFNADVASKDHKKEGLTYPVKAKFSLMNDTIIPENFNYSSSVRLLVSAIGNAYDYAELETKVGGIKSIRVDHLINVMDGKPATSRVRAKRVEEVTDQIKTLRTISVEIDATAHQEYNALRPKGIQLEQNTFTGYLLPVEIIERKEFSKDKQIYINILKRPVLYEYAREAKQIITEEIEMLDLTTYPEGKEPSIDVIKYATQQTNSIRDLILLEIGGRGKNLPFTEITYDHIYKHVEKDIGKKVRKPTVRKNVKKVTTALIAKGKIKKIEIKAKGKIQYGTLRIYR